MINVTFCIGSETHGPQFAYNIVTKNSQIVFIYPIISHCEQQLEKKNLAADENYSHTNVIFLYANITLLKKENFKYLWWDTAFMKNIIQKRYYVFTSLAIGQTVNRSKRFA